MSADKLASAADVVAFWREAGRDKWFEKIPEFDEDIRRRFMATYEAAAAGKLAAWENTAEGALALLILLDQFPRNMFRGDPRAFATDSLAMAITAQGDHPRLRRAGAAGVARLLLCAVRAFGKPRPTRSTASRSTGPPATPTG